MELRSLSALFGGHERIEGVMRSAVMFARLLAPAALGVASVRCGHECELPPCPVTIAVVITVTAAGGPLSAVVVQVSGARAATIPCSSTSSIGAMCYVAGSAGTYELEVSALGFQSAHRTVTVEGTTPECGCDAVVTAPVYVVLVANPPATPQAY
jgi:hypothetical protein